MNNIGKPKYGIINNGVFGVNIVSGKYSSNLKGLPIISNDRPKKKMSIGEAMRKLKRKSHY